VSALDILRSAAEALGLLAAYPWRLLLAVAVFVAVAEALMLIPRIGFVLKMCAASLLAAQVLVGFRVADMGEPPPLRILLDAVYLPPSSMLVLAGCALLPFFIGIAWLAATRGAGSIRFFFGNVFRDRPPESRHFFVFKNIMLLAAVPFTYVAPAMVLKGQAGVNALSQGLVAGMLYWPSLLAIVLSSAAFELLMARLPMWAPRLVSISLSIPLLVLFLAFEFAFTYTLSVRAFGL